MSTNMKNTVTVLYLGSRAIQQYIDRHPIYWPSSILTQRNKGLGDRAGQTPTPMVYEFFSLVAQRQGLFTQSDYRDYCFEKWKDWGSLKNDHLRKGVEAKLYRNVFPSMVNTLHAWALLVEAGWFDLCVIDTLTDACSKHDLIVSRSGQDPIALDLFVGTVQSISDREYKQAKRKSSRDFVCQSFDVPLPIKGRPMRPGNMRWYCLKDFEHVYRACCYSGISLWDTPIVSCTCGSHRNVTLNPSIEAGEELASKRKYYNPTKVVS